MGVAPNRPAAEQVVGNLRLAGIPQDDLSVIMVSREEAEQSDDLAQSDDLTGQGAKEVASSAAKGAALGGTTGVLAGLATLAIPGIGPILGSGILVALFGGAGTFVGALTGAFASENVSSEVIERYGMALREGQAVICITAHDTETAKQAEELLNSAGASNVNSYLPDAQS
jgi:hypothetical protein